MAAAPGGRSQPRWVVSSLREEHFPSNAKTCMGAIRIFFFFRAFFCGQALSASMFGGRECRGCMRDCCRVVTLHGQCFIVFISHLC